MKNANYRKHNDRSHNSSKYHKLDGTPVRHILKKEAADEIKDASDESIKFGPAFQYNGITVLPVGPKEFGRGGATQRVRVVGHPEIKWDREFNAVIG